MPCPYCQAERLPGDIFCGKCGRSLEAGGQGERRQLTLMFCDLAGFTEMSRRLDPEDLRDIVNGRQALFRRTITLYDGFVARYMGDGLLAYFGFPSAHEDDAERAVLAALEIVAESRRRGAEENRMPVRIGIATGVVVVGERIGDAFSAESLAVGQAPNLAARLQALAEPDSVVVADSTRALCAERFSFEDRGTRVLKGFDEPVRCWQVLDARARPRRFSADASALSPLVGRAAELRTLEQHWQRAVRGEGAVAVLVGEAGIGKSRIVDTFVTGLAGVPHEVVCCQCSPHHEHTPLFPVRQELERSAGMVGDDAPDVRLEKLRALLRHRHCDEAHVVGALAALLSLPCPQAEAVLALAPLQLRQRTLRAWVEMVAGTGRDVPVLLLVEDLHWVDPTTFELLELVARSIVDRPVLLLATTRGPALTGWLQSPAVDTLAIERLSDGEAAALVAAQAGGSQLEPARVLEVVARTDGVPLFIEEFVRTMTTPAARDSAPAGSQGPIVPETLHDSLMARLDRLGAGKEVAQVASVIGRRFPADLLLELLPLPAEEMQRAIQSLCEAMVLRPAEEGGRDFLFRHALLRDAAYLSLLHRRRRELHHRIATAIERLRPERARAQPEVLAFHLSRGGEPFDAARLLAEAALRDLDRSANAECLAHATEALEQLELAGEHAGRELLEAKVSILRGAVMRAVRSFASSEAQACFAHALALGERVGDESLLMDARRGLFAVHYARGELAQARVQAEQVFSLAERAGDAASRMLGWWMRGCASFWQGDFAVAEAALAQAVALYAPEEQQSRALAMQIDPGVNAQCHRGWALWLIGRPEAALEAGDKAVAEARERGQPFAIAMTLFFASATRTCCGMFAAARPMLDELKILAAENRLLYMASCTRVLEAEALIAVGRCDEGLQQVEQALAEFETQEAGIGKPWTSAIAAQGWLRIGRVDEGLAVIDAAFAVVRGQGERHWEPELWRLRGQLLELRRSAGDEAAADQCLLRAIECARRQSTPALELRAASAKLRCLAARGQDTTAARAALAAVLERFREGFETADLLEARRLVAGAPAPAETPP